MAKVLIIEPHKLLQQAIALAFFPEHEAQVEAAPNAAAIGELQGIDLIVIDAGALRDRDQLSPEVLRAVQQTPVPVLWLDDDAEARPPKRDNLELVATPIERDALQTALATLISGAAPPRKARAAAEPKAAESKASRKKQAGDPEPSEIPLIDLVEIVEGAPAALDKGESPAKSK